MRSRQCSGQEAKAGTVDAEPRKDDNDEVRSLTDRSGRDGDTGSKPSDPMPSTHRGEAAITEAAPSQELAAAPSAAGPDAGTASDRTDDGGRMPLDEVSRSSIEQQLKSMFDEVASEPVPDRFLNLLKDLERSESGGGSAGRR